MNRPTPPINRSTPPPIQRVTSPSTDLPVAIHSSENSCPSGNPSRPPANSSRSPENSRPMNSGANSQSPISIPSTLGMNRPIQLTSQPMNQVQINNLWQTISSIKQFKWQTRITNK